MRRQAVVSLVLSVLLVAGCDVVSSVTGPGKGRYPEACADWNFPERQCLAIVASALEQSGIDATAVETTWLLPFEADAQLGGYQIARVGFERADGTLVQQDVRCVGVSFGPVCQSDARILVSAGLDRDVPCTGEAPDGCATLRPSPPPDVLAQGVPLEVDALDVPIDHLGEYRVEVGKAVLPDGYLRERSARLVETAPDDYWLGHVGLVVESDVPGRDPAGNIYREPFDGPEPMTVWLVFEVTELFEPSVVEVRDIVVR